MHEIGARGFLYIRTVLREIHPSESETSRCVTTVRPSGLFTKSISAPFSNSDLPNFLLKDKARRCPRDRCSSVVFRRRGRGGQVTGQSLHVLLIHPLNSVGA